MMKIAYKTPYQQRGAVAVEFAIIAMLLFTLLFGIIEFGRLFYVFNTVQEVTRRAAREAVVRWVDPADQDEVKSLALFGGGSLPAYAEITVDDITIEYLNADRDLLTPSLLGEPGDNISECLNESDLCIALVRVSITGATYAPMVGLFLDWSIQIPASTVTMPAESMGYRG